MSRMKMRQSHSRIANSSHTSPVQTHSSRISRSVALTTNRREQTNSNLQTQLEKSQQFGHNLAEISISSTSSSNKPNFGFNPVPLTSKSPQLQLQENPINIEDKKTLSSNFQPTVLANLSIQRKIGDGHDLTSPRFAGDPVLEACFDAEQTQYLRNGSTGPAVEKVQQALIDSGQPLPKFGVDGKFGNETGTAVSKFKSDRSISPSDPVVGTKTIAALDKLFPNTQPPGPQPPGPQPPSPKPPEPSINPQLEDILDAIWLQYQISLKNQNDALNRLEKDLTNLEKPTDFNKDLAKKVLSLVFGAVFGATGDTLRKFVEDNIKDVNMTEDDRKTVIDSGVTPIFDEAKTAGTDASNKKAEELLDEKAQSLDTFIESQRIGITDASDAAQEKFLTQTKAQMRQFTTEDLKVAAQNIDPRIKRAQSLLKSLKKEKLQSFDKQYHESLEKWALGQAQAKLGTKPSNLSTQTEIIEGTDLSKGDTKVSGVLQIGIDGDTSNKPVKVESIKIAGLSQVVRQKLEKENPTIGGLGFPKVAEGKVNPGFLGIKLFNSSIKIAENETDDVFEIGSTDGGKQWLREKAAKAKGEIPDFINKVNEEEGARIVFNEEIDKKFIKDIPDGLQGP